MHTGSNSCALMKLKQNLVAEIRTLLQLLRVSLQSIIACVAASSTDNVLLVVGRMYSVKYQLTMEANITTVCFIKRDNDLKRITSGLKFCHGPHSPLT